MRKERGAGTDRQFREHEGEARINRAAARGRDRVRERGVHVFGFEAAQFHAAARHAHFAGCTAVRAPLHRGDIRERAVRVREIIAQQNRRVTGHASDTENDQEPQILHARMIGNAVPRGKGTEIRKRHGDALRENTRAISSATYE